MTLELDETGNETAYNVYGNDSVISRETADGMTYYLYNGRGDVVQLTNSAAIVTVEYDYDAFGQLHEAYYDDTNPFRYCGEYWDYETKNYYLRARYFAPSTGRFTSRDTYTGRYADPLSLNRYTYGHNNPVKYRDPTGHAAISDIFAGIGTAIGGAIGLITGGISGAVKGGTTGSAIGSIIGNVITGSTQGNTTSGTSTDTTKPTGDMDTSATSPKIVQAENPTTLGPRVYIPIPIGELPPWQPSHHPEYTGSVSIQHYTNAGQPLYQQNAEIYVPEIINGSNADYSLDGYIEETEDFEWSYTDMERFWGTILAGYNAESIGGIPGVTIGRDQNGQVTIATRSVANQSKLALSSAVAALFSSIADAKQKSTLMIRIRVTTLTSKTGGQQKVVIELGADIPQIQNAAGSSYFEMERLALSSSGRTTKALRGAFADYIGGPPGYRLGYEHADLRISYDSARSKDAFCQGDNFRKVYFTLNKKTFC